MAEKRFRSIAAKLGKLRHKEILIAVIAVVVMLVIYFSSLGGSKPASGTGAAPAAADYCTVIREQARDAVRRMSGDGSAEVVISWETGVETLIAYTTSQSQSSSSSSPTVVGGGPIVLKEIYPRALGVIVVVQGGGNVKLRLDVTNMLSVLLAISPEKIAVFGAN